MKAEILHFFDEQLKTWPLAAANYEALAKTRKKSFKVHDFEGWVQYNPARAGSTLAKVDRDSVKKRGCFLCEANRPAQQKSIVLIEGWNLLVNPFPILPFHFTIVSTGHTPQVLSLQIGKQLAELLPGMVVFYNDDGAGASAPDHAHFQAVPLQELPLVRVLEENDDFPPPFRIIRQFDELTENKFPVNAYFWQSQKDDRVKMMAIPRRVHRPDMFYLEVPDRRAVSPGAIDMGGVIVTPFEEDFEAMDNHDVEEIYRQTSFFHA